MAVRRSQLAASEPYRPQIGVDVFLPSRAVLPSPNHELAAAPPYRCTQTPPESFIAWPARIGSWGNETSAGSSWSEEAFTKACSQPRVIIPDRDVLLAAQRCGSSNFAEFMQKRGFEVNGRFLRDGPFNAVDWTNLTTLHGAVAHAGPVKVGLAGTDLKSGRMTPGVSGWAVCDLAPAEGGDECGSVFGYGPLKRLVAIFARHGVEVDLPPGMPAGDCYAIFVMGSVGIMDRESLLNITDEAWVRVPTTIIDDGDSRLSRS